MKLQRQLTKILAGSSLILGAVHSTQVSALEINWKAVGKSKKVDAGVNAEKVIDLDRIRITQKVTLREAPRYNRNDLLLEGARLRKVDEKTEELVDQIQKLIRREKQNQRVGELKMRLAELYYDRARFIAFKESESWAKAVEEWNSLSSAERGRKVRPVLKTPEANSFRKKSLVLYNELEAQSRGADNGKSLMIDRDEVLFYLATTHNELGESKQAIKYFEELTKKFSGSEKAGLAKLSLADAYFESNQYKKALPLYLSVAANKSEEIARLKAYATYRAAWCYSNDQDYKKATLAFLKTVDLSKNDKSAQNLSFIREAYSDLASSFALSGQYNDGWNYFRESVRNKELLEKYELSAAQVAKDRGHYKIAEFFYGKLLSKSPTASFARDLSIDRAENAKKSGNLELYAEKLAELLRDYGAGSSWLKAQKFDSNTEKQMVDDLVSIIRRDAKNFHQAAQKKNNPAQLKRVKPLYLTYFAFVPEKAPDTKENVHEMRYYFSDLLYEAGEYIQSANEYKKVGAGKYETIAAFNRILCFREAAKADKKYNDDLLAATNDFVSQYPNDKRAGDLMYASANQAFESGSQDQSINTLRAIISRFANTERGVDAAERILFLDEKNENFDAVLRDANEFAANATLMATGGEKFKDMISDVRKKAVVKKVEKMPESDKSEQAAKAAAFLSVSAQVAGDLKEKILNNAVVFYKRADDKAGAEKAQAELIKHFPKSQFAKNIYLNQADALLEKADFDEAIRQYTKVLADYKGSDQEKEKILGNLFFVKSHLENAVIPELQPNHSLKAETVKAGKEYLKEFRNGSNKDYVVTVLAYRQGANLNDVEEFKGVKGLNSKTRKLLEEADAVLKVRAGNSSSYPGLIKRFPPSMSYSLPVREAMGQIAFQQVEPKYKSYTSSKVSMVPAKLARSLTEKVRNLEALEKNYTSVVGYGDGTSALKSLERLSDLYKNLADELDKVSDPEAKKELEKFSKSFSDKSKSLIDLCLSKASELKIRGAGLNSCRAKAKWNKGVQSFVGRSVPDLQWVPKLNHKRPLTEFAEKSFKQNKIGSFLLAQDLLERSEEKASSEEKFYMDFLGALFDWREGRGAAAESTLLDLSSRAESTNKRTVVKNLSSLYLQVGDYKQAQQILSGVEEDADVKKLKALASTGLGSNVEASSLDNSKDEE